MYYLLSEVLARFYILFYDYFMNLIATVGYLLRKNSLLLQVYIFTEHSALLENIIRSVFYVDYNTWVATNFISVFLTIIKDYQYFGGLTISVKTAGCST